MKKVSNFTKNPKVGKRSHLEKFETVTATRRHLSAEELAVLRIVV